MNIQTFKHTRFDFQRHLQVHPLPDIAAHGVTDDSERSLPPWTSRRTRTRRMARPHAPRNVCPTTPRHATCPNSEVSFEAQQCQPLPAAASQSRRVRVRVCAPLRVPCTYANVNTVRVDSRLPPAGSDRPIKNARRATRPEYSPVLYTV